MIDTSHPFYRPVWRRVAIVVLTAGWALFEFGQGQTIWALLFAAISAWSAWSFFVIYEGSQANDEGEGKGSTPEKEGE